MEERVSSKKASAIIPVWNGRQYLPACLDALLAQDYPDFEVVVVDDASTDGSADFIAENYPQVQLIRNERNLGFAGGCNVGLQAAVGDVLVLLNQDTVVQPGWLEALAEILLTNPDVGIAGGKALYPDGTIQHAGGYVDERGEGSHYGCRQKDVGQFDQMRDVDYVTGATLAITRQPFEAIGGLDEGFTPAYYEDVDWCHRAQEAGFRVVYAPQAVLIHKEASTIIEMSHEGMYLYHRHRLRFVLKHWSIRRLVDEFVPAERAWLEGLSEGGERLIAAMHHVYLYHLLYLADVMVWRQESLGASLNDADTLADALLTLRTVAPLRLTRPDVDFTDVAGLLGELHQRWSIREQPFRSEIPIFGPLLAAFRRQWNRVSTEWYVRPMIQQQIEFNARVVTMLDTLTHEQRRLVKVLAEYIGEDGREIAELAQEIRQLNTLLEKATR